MHEVSEGKVKMKGVILKKGEEGYTLLQKLFCEIPQLKEYNWLITDCEAVALLYDHSIRINNMGDYGWISGEELAGILDVEDFQWIWAVLSGFNKKYTLEEIREYELPYADGYVGFWKEELSIQHPLAEVELVAWDSSCTLFISREEKLVEQFYRVYPLSEDLKEYNRSINLT